MSYHEKLQKFFKNKDLKQVDVARRINYTTNMTSKYLQKNLPNYQFIMAVTAEFPDIDWNYLFKNTNSVQGEELECKKSPVQLVKEIEVRVAELKEWHKKDTV